MDGGGQRHLVLLFGSTKCDCGIQKANGSLPGYAVRPDKIQLLMLRERGPEACRTACALELLYPLVRLCLRLEVTLLASAVDKDTDPPTGVALVVAEFGY